MKNAYFDDRDLAVMLSGEKLKAISAFRSDVAPVKPDARYSAWLNKNCDCHDYREAMLVLSGSTCLSLNGISYPCLPGTFFLINSKEKHDCYYPPFFDNFRHLWFRIINTTVFAYNPYSKVNGQVKTIGIFNYFSNKHNYAGQLFINAWDRMIAGGTANRDFDWLYLKHAIAGLLLELCKTGNDVLWKKTALPLKLHYKTVIDAVTEHIKETGGKNLDTARLAHIAGYSKFHFARLFKKTTGLSVLEAINLSRLDKYKEFSDKGFNKKQIADKLGFSSPAAFSRWLKDSLRNN
ncbi:MAG: AraC family transcriptional regulator [Victivallales bacterium]|nr:AraC family transcriptional regulator [Victivallales bacterium]